MLMIDAEWPQMANRAPQPDGSSPVAIFVYVEDVDRAVAVTQGIRAHRAAAESVLTAHSLTAEEFDALMYEIASDSAKAAAYRKAIE